MTYRIPTFSGILMLVLMTLFLASCSTSQKTRRQMRKKCDCPKWSLVTGPESEKRNG